MSRSTIWKALTAVLTAGVLVAAGAPGAAAHHPRGAEVGTGSVRFGHFAPSEQPVDLYVDGALAAGGIAFKSVSEYVSVPAGTHRFAVRPSGQPDAPDVLALDAGVPEGGAVTIGAVTTRDGLAAQVYDDALTMPPAAQALVRFIHAAPEFAAVDIEVAGGSTVATSVGYPAATTYLPIDAGTYDLDVRDASTGAVVLAIRGWSIATGVQSTVVIIRGDDGMLDAVPVLDAAAVAMAPVGGVQTGFGGMAPTGPGPALWPFLGPALWPFLAAAVLALCWSSCLLLRRRAAPATVSARR